jgi:hypothetical protein
MSADDFAPWQETIYLLRAPANARRLMKAVARDVTRQGGPTSTKTMDDLESLVSSGWRMKSVRRPTVLYARYDYRG